MAVNDLIQIRKGTSAAWTSANPVLASGEPGYDLTNKIFKIGDGVSNWASLGSINLTSSNITDFGTATSGILPVKNIVAGSNITISSSSGTYTINSTASGTGGGSSSTNVIEYGTVSNFPASGVGSTIYISTDTGRIYRWAGNVYQELGPVSYAPVGSDSRWNLLLPPTPTGVIATPGNTQASVSWSASSATYVPPITDYSIQYSSDSGSTWSTYNHSASSGTSINVTGLVNNTSYIFRTAGINGVGLGSYSTASNMVIPNNSDPLFSNVEILLHFDGNDGSTSFVDSSRRNASITRYGNAAISTSQSRFGGASGRMANAGDYLTFSGTTVIGTSNFCIEFFIYSAWSGSQMILDLRSITQLALWTGGTGGTDLYLFNSGSYAVRAQVTANTWQHIAITRTGSTLRLYIDGSLKYSTTDGSSFSTTTGYIGKAYDANWSTTNFWMDELRVTIGSDRGYNGSTFTVPSVAFLNQ